MHLAARRARAEPADLRMRHARRLTWLRRASLTLFFGLTVLGALWSLGGLQDLAPGSGTGWERLALAVPRPGGQPVLGAPWTLRLFGLEVMDPLAALSVTVSAGPRAAVLLGALPALLLMLVLGRFFCGWVCPYVPLLAASNAVRALAHRAGLRLPDVRLPRGVAFAVLGALLIASAVGGAQLVALIYPPVLIGREVLRAMVQGALGGGLWALGAIWAFDTFVSRAGFCRSLCPGGALFRLTALPSPLWVRRDPAACTDCTVCDVVCNLGQRPMTDGLDSGCERCGKCIAVCPTKALRFEFGRRP